MEIKLNRSTILSFIESRVCVMAATTVLITLLNSSNYPSSQDDRTNISTLQPNFLSPYRIWKNVLTMILCYTTTLCACPSTETVLHVPTLLQPR